MGLDAGVPGLPPMLSRSDLMVSVVFSSLKLYESITLLGRALPGLSSD